jgi:hypothetical protein
VTRTTVGVEEFEVDGTDVIGASAVRERRQQFQPAGVLGQGANANRRLHKEFFGCHPKTLVILAGFQIGF